MKSRNNRIFRITTKVLYYNQVVEKKSSHNGFHGVAITEVQVSIPGQVNVQNSHFYIVSGLGKYRKGGTVEVSDFHNTRALVSLTMSNAKCSNRAVYVILSDILFIYFIYI